MIITILSIIISLVVVGSYAYHQGYENGYEQGNENGHDCGYNRGYQSASVDLQDEISMLENSNDRISKAFVELLNEKNEKPAKKVVKKTTTKKSK